MNFETNTLNLIRLVGFELVFTYFNAEDSIFYTTILKMLGSNFQLLVVC